MNDELAALLIDELENLTNATLLLATWDRSDEDIRVAQSLIRARRLESREAFKHMVEARLERGEE